MGVKIARETGSTRKLFLRIDEENVLDPHSLGLGEITVFLKPYVSEDRESVLASMCLQSPEGRETSLIEADGSRFTVAQDGMFAEYEVELFMLHAIGDCRVRAVIEPAKGNKLVVTVAFVLHRPASAEFGEFSFTTAFPASERALLVGSGIQVV